MKKSRDTAPLRKDGKCWVFIFAPCAFILSIEVCLISNVKSALDTSEGFNTGQHFPVMIVLMQKSAHSTQYSQQISGTAIIAAHMLIQNLGFSHLQYCIELTEAECTVRQFN